MIQSVFKIFSGCISLILYGINTILFAFPIFFFTILKLLFPFLLVRNFCRYAMSYLSSLWIFFNNLNQKFFSRVDWDVKGVDDLSLDGWYMVIANHQSWVDILVLQNIFHNKIPFLKFFIKRELIWFPILGQIWWALEFPFVKRYSKKKLKKSPHLIGKDFELTKTYCKNLSKIPVSIMNFVEGTRFTLKKHSFQGSGYKHLLQAKAGGLSFVLGAMGGKIRKILDVTIAYPNSGKSFWAFICGKVSKVKVRVKVRNITKDMLGDYLTDPYYRKSFQKWLNGIWLEKDKCLTRLVIK